MYRDKQIFSSALHILEENQDIGVCHNYHSCMFDIKWELRDCILSGDCSVDEYIQGLESHIEDCICLAFTASLLKMLQSKYN